MAIEIRWTVANGGWCVARHDGRVVFVRHALPGERVCAEITEETAASCAPTPSRSWSPPRPGAPPCPFAGPGRCGGCDWQHASLDAQRALKADGGRRAAQAPGRDRREGHRRGGARRPRRPRLAHPRPVRRRPRRRRRVCAATAPTTIEPIDACLIAHPEVEASAPSARTGAEPPAVEVIASAGRAAVWSPPKPRRRWPCPTSTRAGRSRRRGQGPTAARHGRPRARGDRTSRSPAAGSGRSTRVPRPRCSRTP